MARIAGDKTDRVNMRIPASQKAMIARAAAITNRDMTDFILDQAVAAARGVIEAAERQTVTERDFERIMDLLDHPPKPNDKLKAAIAALPDTL